MRFYRRPEESGRGTQECVRHGAGGNGSSQTKGELARVISRIAEKFKALLDGGKPRPAPGRSDSTGVAWLEAAPGVEAAANDNGLTILDTAGGRVFVGTDAAAVMWLSASKGLSFGETAEVIAARFGLERNLAENRIRLFLEVLERDGLTAPRAISR